ncbi:MAG: hypothetical protein J0M26_22625 [Planctomycetes bacterium]|nr:hypothetical protein [Planctomycetota bacterium]
MLTIHDPAFFDGSDNFISADSFHYAKSSNGVGCWARGLGRIAQKQALFMDNSHIASS